MNFVKFLISYARPVAEIILCVVVDLIIHFNIYKLILFTIKGFRFVLEIYLLLNNTDQYGPHF